VKMRSHNRHYLYGGVPVTVRWTQLVRELGAARAYVAGYLGQDGIWRDFTDFSFHTVDTATAHALSRAREAIDAMAIASAEKANGPASAT
jgi:hypothetical protein